MHQYGKNFELCEKSKYFATVFFWVTVIISWTGLGFLMFLFQLSYFSKLLNHVRGKQIVDLLDFNTNFHY